MLNVRKLTATLAALTASAALIPAAAQAAWTNAPGSPPAFDSQLRGVTCTSASNCLLVGLRSGTTSRSLIQRWNGSALSTLTGASTTSELYGVTCATTTFCVAVGTDYASGAVPHVESYNGTTWTTMTTPVPSGSTFAALQGIACPSTILCFAGGWYTTGGAHQPFIARYNGTSWAALTLTLPSGATGGEVADISCTSTTACTAVGFYDSSGQPQRSMALRWNGTSWTAQTALNQSGATQSVLSGVACTSSTACIAVGSYFDSLGAQHSLSETWNGTSWTLKTVPDPSGGTDAALADVACSATSTCSAVGAYSAAAGNVAPLATAWNGSAWTVQSVPLASGVSDASLSGVACPSTCLADGLAFYDGSTGVTGVRPAVLTGP